jgi:hypothetical protein
VKAAAARSLQKTPNALKGTALDLFGEYANWAIGDWRLAIGDWRLAIMAVILA